MAAAARLNLAAGDRRRCCYRWSCFCCCCCCAPPLLWVRHWAQSAAARLRPRAPRRCLPPRLLSSPAPRSAAPSAGDTLTDFVLSVHHNEAEPRPASAVGRRRLYRALLKALCGHPLLVGVAGTSVSAGQGVDWDVRRTYGQLVWQWLEALPVLPEADALHRHDSGQRRLHHGYRNTATSGMGSDLAGLCLSSVWSNSSGVQRAAVRPDADPLPEPGGLTAEQQALRTGRDALLPDIALVEFLANDFDFIKLQGSWYFGWSEQQATPGNASSSNSSSNATSSSSSSGGGDGLELNAVSNMRRLLSGMLAHGETAPVLVNTVLFASEQLQTVEAVYAPTVTALDVPVVSWWERWYRLGENDTLTADREQSATAQLVRQRLMIDAHHLSEQGQVDLGFLITQQLQQHVHRLTAAIHRLTYNASSRDANGTLIFPPTAPLLPRTNVSEQPPSAPAQDTYCAIAFNAAQLRKDWLMRPLLQRNFTWQVAHGDKGSFTAETAGALLAFDCLSLLPDSVSSATRPPAVDAVFVSYLGSWSPAVGSALLWLTAELSLRVVFDAALLSAAAPSSAAAPLLSPRLQLNVSAPLVIDSHWAAKQTTATVRDVLLFEPRGLLAAALAAGWDAAASGPLLTACLQPSSECGITPRFHSLTLQVLTLQDNRTFSFVGLFVRVSQPS